MNTADRELIDDVLILTGESCPDWLDERAPVLQSSRNDGVYLIGVIGGKDVGKSSLINALLQADVARVTSWGEGTARALAYTHTGDAAAVRLMLEQAIPDQFDLIEHDQPAGRGRVLLDLPDIDSIYASHITLTHQMLRHMLYPVWVQSIEKYADREPLQLLEKVAHGNAPENFLFALTKVDQLAIRHGDKAIDELKEDFASRVSRVCQLQTSPRIFAINTRDRSAFDLPQLSQTVLAHRTQAVIARSREMAETRYHASMISWLSTLQISGRLSAAQRRFDDANELVMNRLVHPIVDQMTQRLSRESTLRTHLIEPVVRSRLSYWPIINILDATVSPFLRMFSAGDHSTLPSTLGGRELSSHIRGVFADLCQRDPECLSLFSSNKLWSDEASDRAAAALQIRTDEAMDIHRKHLLDTLSKPSLITRIIAPIVTIGAAIWFPLVQPILEVLLQGTVLNFTKESVLLIVKMLGATYLFQSIGFLAIYFVFLWMCLRWFTRRKIDLALMQSTHAHHPAAVAMQWGDDLLRPLDEQVERLKDIQSRISQLSAGDKSVA